MVINWGKGGSIILGAKCESDGGVRGTYKLDNDQ